MSRMVYRMHMNKILTLIAMILIIPAAYAGLEVRVISYDSDTKMGQILIANTGQTDFHDLRFTIDGMTRDYPGSLLKPGSGYIIPQVVEPGVHNVTLSTNEGEVIRQRLLFARTLRKDVENVRVRGQEVSPPTPIGTGQTQKTSSMWYILPLVILVLLCLIFLFIRLDAGRWQRFKGMFEKKQIQPQTNLQTRQYIQPRKPAQNIQAKRQNRDKVFEAFDRGKK